MDGSAQFDEFYRGTARRLVTQVYALTGDLAEAQDCVHEAYARAWQRWRTVGGYHDPGAWVRTVAFRLAVSRWRRARSAARAWGRHGPPAPLPAPSPDTTALVDALRTLPENQRRAIVLHYLADRPLDAIAAELDVPVGTVKSWLSRGRAALAQRLGRDHADTEDLEIRHV